MTEGQRKKGFQVVNAAMAVDSEFCMFMEQGYNPETKEFPIRLKNHHDDNLKRCPYDVPGGFKNIAFNPYHKQKKRLAPEVKYPFQFEKLSNGEIFDYLLVSLQQEVLDRRPIIIAIDMLAQRYIFPGKVKGCERYNELLKKTIIKKTKKLLEETLAQYLLTVTCDPKQYSQNLIEMWRQFRDDCNKILRALKRKYGAKYVSVIESTNNGRPHMHIILGMERWVSRYHMKMKNGREIKSGELHKFIEKRSRSKIFKLQKAGGKGLAYYLTKYLAKDIDKVKEYELEKNIKLPTEERKALLTNLMPIMASIRQVSYSKFQNENIEFEEDKEINDLISEVELYSQMPEVFPKGKTALILLLTKLTAKCCSGAYMASGIGIKAKYKDKIGFHEKISKEEWENMQIECRTLGCGGCIYSNIVRNATKKWPTLLKTSSEYGLEVLHEWKEKHIA